MSTSRARAWLPGLTVGLVLPAGVLAQDLGDVDWMIDSWTTFFAAVQAAVSEVVTDGDYVAIARQLLTVGTVVAFSLTVGQFVLSGFRLEPFITVVLVILLVTFLFNSYDLLTGIAWSGTEGIARTIQGAALGSSELYAPIQYFYRLNAALIFDLDLKDLWPPTAVAMKVFVFLVTMAVSTLLFILVVLATVFGLWGFALAKMLGLMFVPTLLLPRLGFLFDGWLRFFAGFLLYTIIARLNVTITALALGSFYGLPFGGPPPDEGVMIAVDSLAEIVGLLAFLFVSVIALAATGRFVGQIIAGQTVNFSSGVAVVAAVAARTVTRAG